MLYILTSYPISYLISYLMSPRMVWFLCWIWKLQGCHCARQQKKYQRSSEHHERLAGLDMTQRRCLQRRPAAVAQESPMKMLSCNGRTFPLEVAVAHSVALRKQCVQESRAQRVAIMQRRREQSLARAAGAQYMRRVAADH
jgi:hypothetical protein